MTHHLALVEILTKDEDLAAEQEILDIHDERATELEVEIQHLISACSSSLGSNTRKVITRKLTRLYRGVHDISDSLEGDADDICKIRQWQEQLSDFKSELADSLLSMDLEDYDGLNKQQSEVENSIFNVSLKAKRLLESRSAAADSKGINLKFPLSMVTFLAGEPFGSSFAYRCMIAPTSLTRRSWFISKVP